MDKEFSLLGENSFDREATEIENYIIALIKKSPRPINVNQQQLEQLDTLPIDAREELLLAIEAAANGIYRNFTDLKNIRKYLDKKTLKIVK